MALMPCAASLAVQSALHAAHPASPAGRSPRYPILCCLPVMLSLHITTMRAMYRRLTSMHLQQSLHKTIHLDTAGGCMQHIYPLWTQ